MGGGGTRRRRQLLTGARPAARQDISSPRRPMTTFCWASAPVSVARATMLACETSRVWRAHGGMLR